MNSFTRTNQNLPYANFETGSFPSKIYGGLVYLMQVTTITTATTFSNKILRSWYPAPFSQAGQAEISEPRFQIIAISLALHRWLKVRQRQG